MVKWWCMQHVKRTVVYSQSMSLDGRFRMNLPSEQGEVREPAWAPKLK